MIVLVVLVVVALLLAAWLIDQSQCRHEDAHGVANYYDHDLHVFVHLKECARCKALFITRE